MSYTSCHKVRSPDRRLSWNSVLLLIGQSIRFIHLLSLFHAGQSWRFSSRPVYISTARLTRLAQFRLSPSPIMRGQLSPSLDGANEFHFDKSICFATLTPLLTPLNRFQLRKEVLTIVGARTVPFAVGDISMA